MVSLTAIDGKATDDIAENNTVSALFAFVHNALVEEFTTERCVNCPRAASYLHTAIKDKDYGQNIVAICRHAGYYTDDFTLDCDKKYLMFFNDGGSTYAPGIMVDRRQVPETKSPVFNPQSADQILSFVKASVNRGSNVMLDVNVELSEDGNTATVIVSGLKNSRYVTTGKRLYVAIVENDVKSFSQQGADASYRHQHVNRAYNSTWGEEVDWQGNGFSYSHIFNISSAWNVQNMQAIAYIGDYDETNALNNVIDNAALKSFIGTSSIGGVTEIQSSVVGRYDIMGRKINNDNRGSWFV